VCSQVLPIDSRLLPGAESRANFDLPRNWNGIDQISLLSNLLELEIHELFLRTGERVFLGIGNLLTRISCPDTFAFYNAQEVVLSPIRF